MAHGGCDPKPGDLIEIQRGFCQHWALYVGDGYVIHVTGQRASSSTFGLAWGKKAIVKKELLEEVVRNNTWHVNNKYDHFWNPLPVEEIIKNAESWIDKEMTYNLLSINCEHFVTMLRYSVGVSGQVRKALQIWHSINTLVFVAGIIISPALAAPVLAVGASVTAATSSLLGVAARISNFVSHR